jgi:hypothetical protein
VNTSSPTSVSMSGRIAYHQVGDAFVCRAAVAIRRIRDAERRSAPIRLRNPRARSEVQAGLSRRTNRSWLCASVQRSQGGDHGVPRSSGIARRSDADPRNGCGGSARE